MQVFLHTGLRASEKRSKGAPMAQPATKSNVLTILDGQKPTAFYWQLTLLATLAGSCSATTPPTSARR